MVGQSERRRRGARLKEPDSEEARQAWADFLGRRAAGAPVRGIVRFVASSGAFIRISTHIIGFVPKKEIAPFEVHDVNDLLWIGDIVEAVITGVDESKQRVLLSMRQLQARRSGQVGSAVPESEREIATLDEPDLTWHVASAPETTEWPIGRIFQVAYSHRPLSDKLPAILQSLCQETNSDKAFLIRFESASNSVSLVAGTTQIDDSEGLAQSPVRDIWGGSTLMVNGSPESPELTRLLVQLQTKSLIGVPVLVSGRTDHALLLCGYPVNGTSTPLLPAVLCATLMGQYVTQAQAEDALRDLDSMIRLGQLTSAFVHEARNRFSHLHFAFLNLQEMIRMEDIADPTDAKTHRDAMRLEIERVLNVMGQTMQLLEMSYQPAFRNHKQLSNAHKLMREVAEALRGVAAKDRIRLEVTISEDVPQTLLVEENLRQALLNIMHYSLTHFISSRASDQSDLATVVLTADYDPRTHSLVVWVADNGSGIHRYSWSRIFELGFSLCPNDAGLELAVAQQIVESMGGQLSVEDSIMLGGTTFLLRIPAVSRDPI